MSKTPEIIVTEMAECSSTPQKGWRRSQFFTPNNQNNDSFMSADHSMNETQYYSVLENTAIMNSVNDEADLTFQVESEEVPSAEQQEIVFYQMQDTGEFYGMQVAEDEYGNMQKYQFKVIQNENGDFEAVPGTEQLISFEEEETEDTEATLTEEYVETTTQEQMKHEHIEHQVIEDSKNLVKQEYYIEEEQQEKQEEDSLQYQDEETNNVQLDKQMLHFDEDDQQEFVEEETVVNEPIEEEHHEEFVDVQEMVTDFCPNDGQRDDDENSESDVLQCEHEEFIGLEIDEDAIQEYHHRNGAQKSNHALKSNNLNQLTKQKEKQTLYVMKPQKENCMVPRTCNMIRNRRPKVDRSCTLQNAPLKLHKDEKPAKGRHLWNVNSLVSQTTIVQAPVRLSRLPRKQIIEKIDRQDEEIELQEIVVQSNGVIETKIDGVVRERKIIEPTECILLSDDEYTPKKSKKSKSKCIEIIISDSEEEIVIAQKVTEEEPMLTSNKCPKCPKRFPSSGSLRSHMHMHTYEPQNPLQSPKFKCPKCKEGFKNKILLSRHEREHTKMGKLECTICKKLFSNQEQLAVHRRSHVKRSMYDTTITEATKVSPKKQQHQQQQQKAHNSSMAFARPSTSSAAFVRPSRTIGTMKNFQCGTCNSTFSSKLLLDTHVLKSCVKKLTPARQVIPLKSQKCKCDICGVILELKDLRSHRDDVHRLKTPAKISKAEMRFLNRKPAFSGVPASGKFKENFFKLKQLLKEDNK